MRKKLESTLSKYIDSPTWNKKGELKEGDEINGYLVAIETPVTKFGKMKVYVLKTENGFVKINGQSDIRNRIVEECINCHLWVKFNGLVETQNGAKKSYDVECDFDDVLKEKE